MKIPTSFTPTHETAGLPGFPAIDLFAPPGTRIQPSESGTVTRISGHDPADLPPQGQGGPWGLTVYFRGAKTGNTYFLTHLNQVARPGSYQAGQDIGVIGDYPGNAPGADHVHLGLHRGDSPEAHYPSKVFPARCYLSSTPAAFKPTRAAWQWLTGFIRRGRWTHP